MKISLNWIREYLPGLNYGTLDSLIEKMIEAGFDIESVENESVLFENFVVGHVISREKHPNADKLSLCKVDIGDSILNIVCGAPNVAEGQKVCVAKVGAIIPKDRFEIKKSKIRGELSEGMICSESELELSENHDGIMVLDSDSLTGMPFAEYSGKSDIIFELGITPNRGDLLSHFGVAREIAGIYGIEAVHPEVNVAEGNTDTTDLISISIESNSCKRFTGRVIQGIEVKESPEWLKQKLLAVGLRPRNNIVDITNFVMFETGQPLHAFDYDNIRGKQIIVKDAKEGDKFVTLDSKERVLNSASLMVCDAEGYSAIAGIMGGEHSEITGNTRNVFLESAYFDAVSIRKNSKRLGLSTDASHRFERSVDIDMVKYASLRAASLIKDLAGGDVSREILDVYPAPFPQQVVELRISKAEEVLGLKFTDELVISLLEKIGISHSGGKGERLSFIIPEARRADLQREPDLIEEIARLYGYSRVESRFDFRTNLLKGRDSTSEKMKSLKRMISSHLIGRGFNEIITTPMAAGVTETSNDLKPVRLLNSITAEHNLMRIDLAEGLLSVIATNFNNCGKDISLKFFEIGRVFRDKGNSFEEKECVIFGLSGKNDGQFFYNGDRKFDLTDIRGEAEMLLSKLNVENFGLFYYNDNHFKGERIDVGLKGRVLGNIIKADKNLLDKFGIETEVYFCRFFIDELLPFAGKVNQFKEYGKFPSVKRDLALVVEKRVRFKDLIDVINRNGGGILKTVELIDIYEGPQVSEGRKSMAFTLEFASEARTLTDKETNDVVSGILKSLETETGATLRS